MTEDNPTMEAFENYIEIAQRGGGDSPSLTDLKQQRDDINLSEMRNRREKIEHLLSLFDSGEITTICDRLQRDDEISRQLKELTNRRRALRDEIRQKQRELRETRRYTDKVNEIIIDAMQELPCPVCDSLVIESTAETRLQRGDCPHCGQSRSISDLKSDLRDRIDHADEVIKPLEETIEDLQDELAEVGEKIENLRDEEPELQEVDSLVQKALESADYDIEIARYETEEWLEEYRTNIEEDEERLTKLNKMISQREKIIKQLETSAEVAEERIDEVAQDCFESEIEGRGESQDVA